MRILIVRSGNDGFDPISTNQAKSLEQEGVSVCYYDIIGKGTFGYLSNLKYLRRKIREYSPEIIHAHYSFSSILASLSFMGIPVVASLMGSDIYLSSKMRLTVLRFFVRYFWVVTIVKSRKLFDIINVPGVIVIPNGVNFNDFKLVEKSEALSFLGWDKNRVHILFASDPSRAEKNYELAENSIKNLGKSYIKYELHFLKDIDYSQMRYYYCASDVLILTSFYEGSPNVIKEAMVCNCPIVSTNVGDIEEIMKGIDGTYLVEHNVNSVTEGLLQALKKVNRTEGRKIMAEYKSQTVALKLISIYDKIVTEK